MGLFDWFSSSPQNVGSLSDGALDAAYAASFDANQASPSVASAQAMDVYAQEILTRLGTTAAALEGELGYTRFPLYNARGSFNQTVVAQTAVKDAAANVADAAKTIAGYSITTLALIAAIVGGVIYLKNKQG